MNIEDVLEHVQDIPFSVVCDNTTKELELPTNWEGVAFLLVLSVRASSTVSVAQAFITRHSGVTQREKGYFGWQQSYLHNLAGPEHLCEHVVIPGLLRFDSPLYFVVTTMVDEVDINGHLMCYRWL